MYKFTAWIIASALISFSVPVFSSANLTGFGVGPSITQPSTAPNTPSTCASDSIFFDGLEQLLQLEATGAGVGSSDNFTLWIAGSGFANNSYVDVRVPGSSTILQSYTGCARTLTNRNGVSVITFRVTDSGQQSYLNSGGLNLWVVNPSTSTFVGPLLVKRTSTLTTTLTISGAGVGGPDHLSAYVVGTLFDNNAYVDARAASSGNILESYTGSLRTYDAEYGVNILTFQVTDSVQQSVLSRNGLYLWVVNPGSFTGPVIAKRSNAQVKGGSNYNWYHVDLSGTDCNREPYGMVKNYDQPSVRSTVQSQLATMAAGGQRRLRIALAFSDVTSTGTVVQTPNGVFPAQYLTNLQNYLTDIKAAGYQEVEVGMFPIGSTYSFWTASSFSQTIANQYWNLIQQAQNVVMNSGIHYLFDLGNELMPPTGASSAWNSYVTSLWTRYVPAYGHSYTVGFSAPDESRIANMAIYGATPPDVVDLHIYANPTTAYTTADNSLTSQNLPNVDIVIGEAWYDDSTYAPAIRSSVNASSSGRWMRWLTEWARSQSGLQTANCTGQNVQSPLDDSIYLQQGF